MFDYSIKIKVIGIGILVILIGSLIWLVNYNNSRTRDLEIIFQTRELATSLEKYFDKNNTYPIIDKTKLANIQVITENGLNKEGDYLFFRAIDWVKEGTLISTKERYIIEFQLDNSWELWGLDNDGGICKISNYLEMICQPK